MESHSFDIIIIGGGITGAGVARDASLRGLRVLLLEQGDIADGASGRNHGLLHSGARYAVTDPEGARECIEENRILRRIAKDCIEETEGLFISLPSDSLDYQSDFIRACRRQGIPARKIDPQEALRQEPLIHPHLIGAVSVPDASVDPFRLTAANIYDAVLHGAVVRTRCAVVGLLSIPGRICGVEVEDIINHTISRYEAPIVVNAAGVWSAQIALMAGVQLNMQPCKGSLLVFAHRYNRHVINRCRKPGNADIIVPNHLVSILGTTSSSLPIEACRSVRSTREEVDALLKEGSELMPVLARARVLRTYSGVRPLVAADSAGNGREISRGMVLLDHEQRDGLQGLITITGGKLTTYRYMAEKTTDLVCDKLHVNANCSTHRLSLPTWKKAPDSSTPSYLCDCERIGTEEIAFAVQHLGVRGLDDLRRRTHFGMGSCQGTYCSQKVAAELSAALQKAGIAENTLTSTESYIQERWKGIIPVLWGDTMRQAELLRTRYAASVQSHSAELPPLDSEQEPLRIVIIGAGRSGIEAGIQCKQSHPQASVRVLSAGKSLHPTRRNELEALGGMVLDNCTAISGEWNGNRLMAIHTDNGMRWEADLFVMATGRFFSGGLVAEPTRIIEPVLDCDVYCNTEPASWAAGSFLQEQPFESFGVRHHNGRVFRHGEICDNVYAVGGIKANEKNE